MSDNQSVWDWFEKASSQAKEIAAQAHVAAAELSKQAAELQRSYNTEVMSSILNTEGDKKPASSGEVDRRLPRKNVLIDDIDITYVTENLVGMGYPYTAEKRRSKWDNDIRDVSDYLQNTHNGHYMIWNISEDTYDYSYFFDQVLEYKFPGHPAPPLGLIFKMCTSMESWLDADDCNIAVVHCLTGKGRTAVVLACVLTWIGEFSSPMEALHYVATRRNSNVDALTIPSQRRYIHYFSNVLDGVRPRAEPLLLRRVIMNGIPRYGEDTTDRNSDGNSAGCCPYLQLFKNCRIIANGVIAEASTSGSTSACGTRNESQWVRCSMGSVSFQMDCMVQGDLLLRCRHHDIDSGARVSMFRTAFHTGYVSSGVLRLTKSQLDGPNTDDRYCDDFFIDLIFAPVEKPSTDSSSSVTGMSDSGAVMDSALTDKFEQMLHRNACFWESVGARKARAKRRRSRKFMTTTGDKFSIVDKAKRAPVASTGGASLGSGSDDEDEVSFSARPVGGIGVEGISDDELIRQLVVAEAEEDSSCSAGCTKAEATYTAPSDGQSDQSLINSDRRSWHTSPAASSAIPPPSTNKELDALEELEREIGFDLRPVPEETGSVGLGIGAEMEDLDDLEAFLESLTAGTFGS